jgi:glutamate racemase
MLDLSTQKIVDVKPPIKIAKKITKTKQIGILATKSAINSKGLSKYIIKNNFSKSFKIFKINGSNLVDLVESGKFLTDKKYCRKIIKKDLEILAQQSIDTITLSSTHLIFLKSLLKKEFPNIRFIDSGNIIAKKIFSKIKHKESKRNSLKIYTSDDVKNFQIKLNKIGIKNKVNFLSF